MDARPWHEHYDPRTPTSIDYEDVVVGDYLRRTAGRSPSRPAIVFQNKTLTYGEFQDHVDRLATAMTKLGLEPGDRVAIQLPNVPQVPIAYYAALQCGAQVVLTNPLYMPREIEHQWNDAGCKIAVTMDFLFDQKVKDIRRELCVEHYILASIPEYLGFPLNLLAPFKLKKADPPAIAKVPESETVHRFKKLIKSTRPAPPSPTTSRDEIAVLQYTGGTTGRSKGAMLTHANLTANVQQLDAWFPDAAMDQEVMLACLPLFHVFGMTGCMNWSVAKGTTMVLIPNPRDVGSIVTGLEKHRATLFPAVPAMFNAINHFRGIESRDLSSVKVCVSGSAPIAEDILEKFEALSGAVILEGFGLSETSPVTHVNPVAGRKIGWIGIPVADTDCRIVSTDQDDSERELPPGEEGEVVIRGPQVMRGYWNLPEETAGCLRDGWLHTGDLGVMDEDGFFKIVGRMKDMINASGLKIFPDEVDAVLMSHPKILEAATIGVPHERRGETVKSFLVLQPDVTLTKEEVDAFARENMAAYKVPREIEFIDELPKSTVLKVLRRELRDRELAKRNDRA